MARFSRQRYAARMPYKRKMLDTLPAWVYELSIDDECLLDVLSEAWVARSPQEQRRSVRVLAAGKDSVLARRGAR